MINLRLLTLLFDHTQSIKTIKIRKFQVFSLLKKNSNSAETISLGLRRSIFAKNITKNSKLTTDNIETLRPYIGICASKYFKVLGKEIKKYKSWRTYI